MHAYLLPMHACLLVALKIGGGHLICFGMLPMHAFTTIAVVHITDPCQGKSQWFISPQLTKEEKTKISTYISRPKLSRSSLGLTL
jgi:hypothetical protein